MLAPTLVLYAMLRTLKIVVLSAARTYDAASACAAFNVTVLIELMHGFGWGTGGIDGYTRNSGCGNACGRPYFRWDNGPQGFDDGAPAGNATQWPVTTLSTPPNHFVFR